MEMDEPQEWLDNDFSRRTLILTDWRLLPPIVFSAAIALDVIVFRYSLLIVLPISLAIATLVAVIGYFGERNVVVSVATTETELVWIDKGNRKIRIPLARIRTIAGIRGQAEGFLHYRNRDGRMRRFVVGPKAAEMIADAADRNWKREPTFQRGEKLPEPDNNPDPNPK